MSRSTRARSGAAVRDCGKLARVASTAAIRWSASVAALVSVTASAAAP